MENQIIMALIWILCGMFVALKQSNCMKEGNQWNKADTQLVSTLAFISGPIWLLAAIIRQAFIEKWH